MNAVAEKIPKIKTIIEEPLSVVSSALIVKEECLTIHFLKSYVLGLTASFELKLLKTMKK